MSLRKRMSCLILLALVVFPQLSVAQNRLPRLNCRNCCPHMSMASANSPQNGTKMFNSSIELLESTIAETNKQNDIDVAVILGDLTKDTEPWNVDRFKDVMATLNTPNRV